MLTNFFQDSLHVFAHFKVHHAVVPSFYWILTVWKKKLTYTSFGIIEYKESVEQNDQQQKCKMVL